MLEPQNNGEKDGNLIVETIERSLVVLVFLVPGPDVGRDKIDIILGINQHKCLNQFLTNSSAFMYRKRSGRTRHLTNLYENKTYIVTNPPFLAGEVPLQVLQPGLLYCLSVLGRRCV